MVRDHSRNVHRCVALVMGVVFATATSTQVSAQSRTDWLSQSSVTETPAAAGRQQPVQALGGQLAVFLGHYGSVESAIFSPDGRQILTASDDKTYIPQIFKQDS